MHFNYVIIGGGIAGISAAEKIREFDSDGSIAVFEDESHLLYSRVLLPSYLKGAIPRRQIYLRTLADFEKSRINMFIGKKATAIDHKQKKITLENYSSVFYDKLLIATGGSPENWNIMGSGKEGIFHLRNLDDAEKLKEKMAEARIKKAAVTGDSFFALQILEVFSFLKIPGILIFKEAAMFFPFLNQTASVFLDELLKKHGVETYYKTSVGEILGDKSVTGIQIKHGDRLNVEAVVTKAGLDRNADFFSKQGIAVGKTGIKTNEYLETSVESIWAAGEVAEFYDVILKKYRLVNNWTESVLQGVTAGINMAGTKKEYKGIAVYSTNVFDLHITTLGETEDSQKDSENAEIIYRQFPLARKHEAFLVKDGFINGALLINSFEDRTVISRLIENRVDIGSIKNKLGDPNWNLSEIEIL